MSGATSERVVEIEVEPRSYPVIIGAGALTGLGERLGRHVKSRRAMVLTDENVGPLYAKQAMASLAEADFQATLLTIPAGEGSRA